MSEILLQMKKINKKFGNNQVLTNVDLDLNYGEVLGLLGENGAGKSTLMKILTGIYQKDSGEILIKGKSVKIDNAEDGKKSGIRIIHQELMLCQNISIAENIYMGQELKNQAGFVNIKRQLSEAQKMLDKYNLGIQSSQLLNELTIAQQQMIEIIRAISFGAEIVVMDEPTSSLSSHEIQQLYGMIKKLQSENVGIIYISHKLNELFDITNRITVLRDGYYIDTVDTNHTSRDELVRMMVGREISKYYYKTNIPQSELVMSVKNLSDGKRVKNVSFDLFKGEILGCAGLIGAGRSEAMQCISGLRKRISGNVKIDGNDVVFFSAEEAMKHGVGYVPEDRKIEGLFLQQGMDFNITINVLKEFIKKLYVNKKTEQKLVKEKVEQFSIRASSFTQTVSELSGGNQQKILIARWLMSAKKILILDEPTRGVDVKSKADIYQLIDWIANSGISVIMVSSELPELLSMCDRICVFSNGNTTGILNKSEFSQEAVMRLATS